MSRRREPCRSWLPATTALLLAVSLWIRPADAQTLSGPSDRSPQAAFSLRDHKTSLLYNERKPLWDRCSRLVGEITAAADQFDELLASERVYQIRPQRFGEISTKVDELRRAALRLEMLGELSGEEFQGRAVMFDGRLAPVKAAMTREERLAKAIAKEVNDMRQLAQRNKKKLAQVETLARRENWESALDTLEPILLDLAVGATWADSNQRRISLASYDSLARTVREKQRMGLGLRLVEATQAQRPALVPALAGSLKGLGAKIDEVARTGTAKLGDTADAIYTGPQLLGQIENLWRLMQTRSLRLRAQDWIATQRRQGVVSLKTEKQLSEQLNTLEKDYAAFNEAVIATVARLIEVDAARVAPEETAVLYREYLAALAPLVSRSGDPALRKAVDSALESLIARSAELAADVAAYRAMTGEMLTWRRRVAEARAALRQRTGVALQTAIGQALAARPESNSRGLSFQGGLPTVAGATGPVIEVAAGELLGKTLSVPDVVRELHDGEPRLVSRLNNNAYVVMSGGVQLAAAAASLKNDLLVDDRHAPLTLDAAVALYQAEHVELAEVGAAVEGIELLSLVNQFAMLDQLPAQQRPPLRLGPLPDGGSTRFQPVRGVVIKLQAQATWVRHEYFFVDQAGKATSPADR